MSEADAPLPDSRRVAREVSADYLVSCAEPICDPGNPKLLRGAGPADRRYIVWDSGIPALWRTRFTEYFQAYDVMPVFIEVKGGETAKQLSEASDLLRALSAAGFSSATDPLMIVGGGAVLDMAGFAASVCHGAPPVVRIPTTLLSCIDAAVGVKTAVNFGGRKNLLGTFTPPSLVLFDRDFFVSQCHDDWTSGYGEILKLGLGCDRQLFEMLEAGAESFATTRMTDDDGQRVLHRSIDIILRELRGNLFEKDLARVLDLGHTFSQPFETGTHPLRHGHAVAHDLLLSAKISVGRGLLTQADLDRVVTLSRRLDLPVLQDVVVDTSTIWDSLAERVQHRSDRQRVPLPVAIGLCHFFDDIRPREVDAALRWLCSEVTR